MKDRKGLFNWIIPLAFGLAGTTWGNLIFLDEYILSSRRAFASLIVFSILFLSSKLILKAVPEGGRNFKPFAIWLSPALIAIPISLAFPGTLAYLQNHEVEITAQPGNAEVVFAGINTGSVDVPISTMDFSGDWQKTNTGYTTSNGGSISWSGRVSSHPAMVVLTGTEEGALQISWGGIPRYYSLKAETQKLPLS